MIDRKFLFFKTRQGFENKRKEIQNESIVFIKGETPADRAIWTHGVFYEPSVGQEHSKGFFETYLTLYNKWPWPTEGDWAIVADNTAEWVLGDLFPATLCEQSIGDWYIYTCNQNGVWTKTNRLYNKEGIDLSEYIKHDEINLNEYVKHSELNLNLFLSKLEAANIYATKVELLNLGNSKQDRLISGQNIATVNGLSLLNNSNIDLPGDTVINQVINQPTDISGLATKEDLNKYVKTSEIGNYIISGPDIDIDTDGFATKEQLTEYVKKSELKTINGESLIGTGNIIIEGGTTVDIDLSQFVTRELFENYNKILSVQMPQFSPTLFEYTGQPLTITCGFIVKKGSDLVVPTTLSVNGASLLPASSGTFTITHDTFGKKNVTLTATLGSETASVTKSSTSVRPTYYGFSTTSTASNSIINELTRVLIGSISINTVIPNTVPGSYLWIVTQFDINKVAVDENFTYTVAMEDPVVIGDHKYYRSKQQVDVCELTYYIK